jgi:CubicO group peptidase (beta-lactamase class C family)
MRRCENKPIKCSKFAGFSIQFSAVAIRILMLGVLVNIAIGADPSAGAAAPSDIHAVDALVLRLMSEYHVPGAALGLIKDGEVVMEKGYGLRDVENRTPVTTQTMFNIGSISKSFTALGIAQLVDQHKVDLDAPVIRYLPELRLSDPTARRMVTLRQLLSHSGGLPPDEQWPPEVPPNRADIMREFATMPITAEPGTRFQYCSRCVGLAAMVLEAVTDQSWEAYTRTHIFGPLGMATASFGPIGLERATNVARPYRYDGASGTVLVPWRRLDYLDSLGPAGGINASIEDLTRYALFQLGAEITSGVQILSKQRLEEMHRPQIAVPKSWTSVPIQDLHYGLGWFTGEYRGARIVFHNGSNPGYRASIMLAPSSHAGVIVLTNGESMEFISSMTLRLIEELLHEDAKVQKQTH